MKKIIMLALCFALMMSCAAVAEVKVAKVDDLKQAKIGVQAGSIAEALVHDLFDDDAENNNITAFETVFEVIEALKAKKIDAAVMDEAHRSS